MQGTLNQPYVALLCVYLGMAGAFIYYLLKRSCRLLHIGRVGRAIGEISFCLLFFGVCAWIFFRLLYLRLRLFYLVGILLGALIYRFGLHFLLEEVAIRIYNLICKKQRKK